jgi:hypothetical protein
LFQLRRFDSIAADENSAARLRRFTRSRYHLAVLALFAQTPPRAPSPSPKESPPASAGYDLRWDVKISMRDKVELITIRKTAD